MYREKRIALVPLSPFFHPLSTETSLSRAGRINYFPAAALIRAFAFATSSRPDRDLPRPATKTRDELSSPPLPLLLLLLEESGHQNCRGTATKTLDSRDSRSAAGEPLMKRIRDMPRASRDALSLSLSLSLSFSFSRFPRVWPREIAPFSIDRLALERDAISRGGNIVLKIRVGRSRRRRSSACLITVDLFVSSFFLRPHRTSLGRFGTVDAITTSPRRSARARQRSKHSQLTDVTCWPASGLSPVNHRSGRITRYNEHVLRLE